MASIGKDTGGRKRILFVAQDGSRKTVRLGKCSQKQAEAAKIKIEALVAAQFNGSLDDEVSRWLVALPDNMHKRLVAVGLVKPRATNPDAAGAGVSLGRFLDEYTQSRVDVKPGTRLTYGRTRQYLLGYFHADKRPSEISEGDADAWRLHLLGRGLAISTVNRACGMARQFFRAAVRRKLIGANPFTDLESSVKGNKAREFFVSREDTEKIIATCPDIEWKLIFALARYGGLRTPSETLLLRWGDVLWDEGKLFVRSPKTEHHPGGESRYVPLFPELKSLLLEALEDAEPGAEFIIVKHRKPGANLRTQLLRIMARAGVKPWPRLFQNLRATRQTELAEHWPEHIVCGWIGNSQVVAREHYLMARDEDFLRAAEPSSAAQNPAQQPAEMRCKAVQNVSGEVAENAVLQGAAADCRTLQNTPLGGRRFELLTSCVSSTRSSQLS
jgi:integrase